MKGLLYESEFNCQAKIIINIDHFKKLSDIVKNEPDELEIKFSIYYHRWGGLWQINDKTGSH